MFNSPLEQFEIFPLKVLKFYDGLVDISLTNFTLFLFINFFIVFNLLYLGVSFRKIRSTKFQIFIEQIFNFVLGTLKQQAGPFGLQYFLYYFLIFLFILMSNLIGLVPFCFTVTSHLILVSFIALTSNIAFVLIGFHRHGIAFLNLFVPSSAPRPLIPLITTIEFASYLIRTLSLSLRLFANMMAGHILLYILASFSLRLAGMGFIFVSIIPIILMIAVFMLELGICFIQAYVFLVLLSIYLSESIVTPGH